MDDAARLLALNGALLLLASLVAGLLLHLRIRHDEDPAAWHLAHAGGSGRGVLLLALAASLHFASLPGWRLGALTLLVLAFSWTSMAAMTIAAATGERGLRWNGGLVNRAVFALYVISAVTMFPATIILILGLWRGHP